MHLWKAGLHLSNMIFFCDKMTLLVDERKTVDVYIETFFTVFHGSSQIKL